MIEEVDDETKGMAMTLFCGVARWAGHAYWHEHIARHGGRWRGTSMDALDMLSRAQDQLDDLMEIGRRGRGDIGPHMKSLLALMLRVSELRTHLCDDEQRDAAERRGAPS
jgi:hypothetical protein